MLKRKDRVEQQSQKNPIKFTNLNLEVKNKRNFSNWNFFVSIFKQVFEHFSNLVMNK